jgi:hypothetical protein
MVEGSQPSADGHGAERVTDRAGSNPYVRL